MPGASPPARLDASDDVHIVGAWDGYILRPVTGSEELTAQFLRQEDDGRSRVLARGPRARRRIVRICRTVPHAAPERRRRPTRVHGPGAPGRHARAGAARAPGLGQVGAAAQAARVLVDAPLTAVDPALAAEVVARRLALQNQHNMADKSILSS